MKRNRDVNRIRHSEKNEKSLDKKNISFISVYYTDVLFCWIC